MTEQTIEAVTKDILTPTIATFSDDVVFEEVAMRLKRLYRKQHQLEFLYGCFEFIFHDGRFQGIEDRPRFKRYRSPKRIRDD